MLILSAPQDSYLYPPYHVQYLDLANFNHLTRSTGKFSFSLSSKSQVFFVLVFILLGHLVSFGADNDQ